MELGQKLCGIPLMDFLTGKVTKADVTEQFKSEFSHFHFRTTADEIVEVYGTTLKSFNSWFSGSDLP